jgi:hypothetical protein
MIEAFWLHARNIIEVLNHPKNKNGVLPRATVSAKDFTKYSRRTQLAGHPRSHQQCSYTSSVRSTVTAEEKLAGCEMQSVKNAIDREIKTF